MKQAEALKLFSLIYFTWGFWAAPFGFFVSIYLSQSGMSDSLIGLLFGVNFLVAPLVAIPLGMLSDRLNPRNAIIAGMVLTAPFYLAITLTDSIALLALFFILDSIGANLTTIATESTMYRSVISEKSKAFGLIHLLYNIGIGIGLFFSGQAIAAWGFGGLGTAMLVPALLVIILALKLPRQKIIIGRAPLSKYLADFRRREFLLFAVAVFLLAYHWGAEKTSFPLYASNILQLTSEQLGLLFSLNLFVYAIAGFLAGRQITAAKAGEKFFMLGLAISALGSVAYAFSYDFGSALLSRILHDAGVGMLSVTMMLAIASISGKERTGGTIGAMAIIYALANFTGSVASGYVNQYFGYSSAILLSAILTIASGAALFLALRLKISPNPFRQAG